MKTVCGFSRLTGSLLGLSIFAMASTNIANAAIIFSDRTAFEATLGTFIVDDYSNPGYAAGDIQDLPTLDRHSDANMSAILGETSYTSTSFASLIAGQSTGDPAYCTGCNGSFLLDFTSTSVGSALGVFGVGLDVLVERQGVFGTIAFVTFGDGTTGNFAIPGLPTSTTDEFWGITSPLFIASIHFGLLDGGATTDNSVQRMALDNLTIGSQGAVDIPEPSNLALFLIALGGLGFMMRRRVV